MKIAILDDYQNCISSLEVYKLLEDHQVQIIHRYQADEATLINALDAPDALILNRTRTHITEALLAALPSLKVISQTGKNAGHIDIEACKKYNIEILEGRGDPTATAELAWSLIMNGLRQLPQAIAGMKKGKWQINVGRRVRGATIGIWGYGRIGKKLAAYARAFDAKVVVWGSEISKDQARKDGFETASSKQDFFQNSDVVTIHLRLKPATEGVITHDDFALMKKDALFVNTSRAKLIEEGALLRALQLGRPGYAAIDVFDEEPIFDPDHILLSMPNVICTPHLGYVEKASYELYFGIAFQNLLDWFAKNNIHS